MKIFVCGYYVGGLELYDVPKVAYNTLDEAKAYFATHNPSCSIEWEQRESRHIGLLSDLIDKRHVWPAALLFEVELQ